MVFALPVMSMAPSDVSLALFLVWFLYHATDWWSNPGQGAWAPAFLLVLVGWLLVIAEVRRLRGQA